MKKLILGCLAATALFLTIGTASANDVMVASAMQRCTTNEECTLITNSCSDNCGFVPVNKLNLTGLQQLYQSRCGKPMEANPQCNINPPISSACVNSRCTIDYAYANHAGAKDYKAGAYPVPEAAVPSRVPAAAAPANDRNGFTAYGLPQNEVKNDNLGQIITKVYVPPSAPVTGENYVPVNISPRPQAAPAYVAPAPVAPKATVAPYAPTSATYATQPVAKPVPAPAAYPEIVPPPAPGRIPAAAPVAAMPKPAPVPTATTTPRPIATPANPIPSSASDRIPEPRVPDTAPLVTAPSPVTGNPNAPVPPSDFKEQKLISPPGSTSLVAPEDPGAVPQDMILQAPVPRGPDDDVGTFGVKKKTTVTTDTYGTN